MHFLERELDETRKKSYNTVEETRCVSNSQISEIEDKVNENSEKKEETRRASRQQSAEILAEEKEKVANLWWLHSKDMTKKMADMEENIAEVRQVTCIRMSDKKYRVEDFLWDEENNEKGEGRVIWVSCQWKVKGKSWIPYHKNANQYRLEVKRRLKRFEDVSMYQLARIKYVEEYHYQPNFFVNNSSPRWR